ncbi:MAG TPA: helix-turn-helix transcriptional regulator [Candidatus Angelobacter sp.]
MSREIRKRFGARIRELRVEQKMRQLDLAVNMDVQESYVSNIETGSKEPCLEVIEKLSKGLGVSLRKIFWDL